MQNIILDVGANSGDSCIHFAKNQKNSVYAFEPTPELCEIIRKKTEHLPNYFLIPKAVSDFDGTATFNIAGQADWGCSSLLQFDDNISETWKGRTDFKVTHQVEVDVITLRSFMQQNNIEKIDFLHCDAQGNDLTVLRSLGDKLGILKKGVIEVSKDSKVQLYKASGNTLAEARKFLKDNGFIITNIQANSPLSIFANEYNVSFSRGAIMPYLIRSYSFTLGKVVRLLYVAFMNVHSLSIRVRRRLNKLLAKE